MSLYDLSLGERIKLLRTKRNMSQEELARAVGVTKSAISKYELDSRTPKHELISRFSEVFGIEPFLLLTGRSRSEWTTHYEEEDQRFWDNMEDIILDNGLKQIKDSYEILNEDGQREAVKRVEELTEIPRYRRQAPAEAPPTAPEGKDTTPPPPPPESTESDE